MGFLQRLVGFRRSSLSRPVKMLATDNELLVDEMFAKCKKKE